MKKKWPYFVALILMILFILIPWPAADLFLRIHLDEAEGINPNDFYLYYGTTEAGFSSEQLIQGTYDAQTGIITYRLSASLEGKLTDLRVDFPSVEQLLKIKSVTVSSGGLAKKAYNPCYFFADANLADVHGIEAVNVVPTRAVAYVSTHTDDPYIVLSGALSKEVANHFSHYFITRILLCVFACACVFSAKRKLFKE